MKLPAPPSHSNQRSPSSSRRYSYQKVTDNRKHPIRGRWRRKGKFYARLIHHKLKRAHEMTGLITEYQLKTTDLSRVQNLGTTHSDFP